MRDLSFKECASWITGHVVAVGAAVVLSAVLSSCAGLKQPRGDSGPDETVEDSGFSKTIRNLFSMGSAGGGQYYNPQQNSYYREAQSSYHGYQGDGGFSAYGQHGYNPNWAYPNNATVIDQYRKCKDRGGFGGYFSGPECDSRFRRDVIVPTAPSSPYGQPGTVIMGQECKDSGKHGYKCKNTGPTTVIQQPAYPSPYQQPWPAPRW